jgi:hypothetical protein
MTPRRFVALLGLSAGVYAITVRPRMLRWGASNEEVRQPFPGAGLIPGGQRGADACLENLEKIFRASREAVLFRLPRTSLGQRHYRPSALWQLPQPFV